LHRIPERDAGERQHDGNLRDNDPAAAATKKRAECVSAWNKDPVSGVIGVQTGPH
jgi:hypothetical protein